MFLVNADSLVTKIAANHSLVKTENHEDQLAATNEALAKSTSTWRLVGMYI